MLNSYKVTRYTIVKNRKLCAYPHKKNHRTVPKNRFSFHNIRYKCTDKRLTSVEYFQKRWLITGIVVYCHLYRWQIPRTVIVQHFLTRNRIKGGGLRTLLTGVADYLSLNRGKVFRTVGIPALPCKEAGAYNKLTCPWPKSWYG